MHTKLKRIFAMILAVTMIVSVASISASALELEACKSELRAAGFPEDYVTLLAPIKQAHENWTFEPLNTGVTFDAAVAAESRSGYCTLVPSTAYDLLVSKNLGTYNSDGSYSYHTVDSGGYVDASDLCISYFMDPRNFISDYRTLFQFMELSDPTYMDDDTLLSTLNSMVSGTFLEGSESGETYAHMLLTIGREKKINPLYLVSKIFQEVGQDGTHGCVSGNTTGYNGYYNYYNIGAYSHDGRGAIENGLIYAKNRGWSTRAKAIKEGATFIATSYICGGQNTTYLTKFNVNPSGNYAMYEHQYMTAVYDPAKTANAIYSGCSSALGAALKFVIPVYSSMPTFSDSQIKLSASGSTGVAAEPGGYKKISIRYNPAKDSSTKTYLADGSTLTIKGRLRSTTRATGTNLPEFQLKYPFWYQVEYGSGEIGYTAFENLNVSSQMNLKLGSTVQLEYITDDPSALRFESIDSRVATVDSKTGIIVAKGLGTTKIVAYTAKGSVDYINLTVAQGDVPAQFTSSTYSIDQTNNIISGISCGTSVESLLAGIDQSLFASVYDGNTKVSNCALKTGMTLNLMSGPSVIRSYAIAVRGDANGDGAIKTGDAVAVLRYIAGSGSLSGVYAVAADANGDGAVKTGDAVTILKSIG